METWNNKGAEHYAHAVLCCLEMFEAGFLMTRIISSSRMRKPDFGIFENKDTDQLCGNLEADQSLCFRYIDTCSTIPLCPKSVASFSNCVPWFVSDLVGNPEERFS